jgi:radical SAM protein (TIGR01212 family)
MSLADQWNFWRELHMRQHGLNLFTAYLQSYSNTHGPIAKLATTLQSLKGLPGLTTLNLGTRPDCLDTEKLDLLAAQRDALQLADVTLELGLQSSCDATLSHINRGHNARAFAEAVHRAAERGITVVAHIMAGLPTMHGREGRTELLASVDFINRLPVSGVKFHNLYVCRETALAALYDQGYYTPMTQREYLTLLSDALMQLKPTTVIHRLNGNPQQGELLSPDWASNMRGLHNAVRNHFDAENIWQGKQNGAEEAIPEWYSAKHTGGLPC